MKNFIFDIDGTLLDTEAMYIKSLQAILHEQGMDRPYAELATTFGIPSKDALIRLKVPNVAEVLALWGPRTQDYRETVAVYPGVKTALQQLRAAGANLAVMTSKQKFEYKRDVVGKGLADYFTQHVIAEDVAHGKPAPDGILLAMQRLHADPATTIYVGDTDYDVQASKAAQVTFGFAGWNGKQPAGFTPDVTFKQPQDMLKLL
ncbi:HAD family hydrolase [Levilactobacillus tujiorum]|uniref:HAD family hydrolase n=1 Tax=Levilactobacillus tujiorum TaxID=2912243 RepID=UPI001456526D|nr:HAD family hydrolase [Levilactobacillus tujiorum]NLR31414.1 HAD family hydrolase [Levilactobacillus tujiorum]